MKKILTTTIALALLIAILVSYMPVSVSALTQQEQEDIYRVKTYRDFATIRLYVDALLNSDNYCYHLAVEDQSLRYTIVSLDSAEEAEQVLALLLNLSGSEIRKQSKNEVYCKLLGSFCDEFIDFIDISTLPEAEISKVQGAVKEVSDYYLKTFGIDTSVQLESGAIDYDDILDQVMTRCEGDLNVTAKTKLITSFNSFKESTRWLEEVRGITKIAGVSSKVFSIASESFALLAELESYKVTDERIKDLLFKIAYSTSNEMLRDTALTLRTKLMNSYEENLADGIAEIIDDELYDFASDKVKDYVIGKFGLVGTMAKLGIDCGVAASNMWFNTGKTIQLKKSIWCLNEVSEILVMLAQGELEQYDKYTSDSTYKAETAARAIYYLRALSAYRKQGESTYYELEKSIYGSTAVGAVRALDFLDLTGLDSELDIIEAWNNNTKEHFKSIDSALFSEIHPNEYVKDPVQTDERLATDFEATVEDGIYTIKNADSGKMMNVYAGKNADATNVVTWQFDGTTDQRFSIKHIKNGQYIVYAVCSSTGSGSFERCLDIYTGGTNVLPKEGNNVDIYKRDEAWNKSQLFYIVPMGDGTVVFESCSVPGLVISAQSPSTNNGNIAMAGYDCLESQQWYLCDTGGMQGDDLYINDYTNIGDYADDILGVARTQLGYMELDVATGAPLYNGKGTWYTKYGQRFNNSSGAWCAFFVMWCAEQADIPTTAIPQAQTYGSCSAMANWFKNNGLWQDATYTPWPGDIVFFDWDDDGKPNHVGIVESINDDGSINTIEGNVCLDDNLELADSGYYQVGQVTRSEDIFGYGTPSFNFTNVANSVVLVGGKTNGKAYMLPDANSDTVWYVDANDRCVVLCWDNDYYLLMYPFLNTGKYVTAYVPADIVSVFSEPYFDPPFAEDYYTINKQVVLKAETKAYHNPSTSPLMSASTDLRIRATWSKGSIVTVLFKYGDFYFVRTETQTGFVPVSAIDLTNVPESNLPDDTQPDDTTPTEPDQPTTTPPAGNDDEEDYLQGDVDGDGKLGENDGLLILQFAAKLLELNEKELTRADADGNGVVNVADAATIFTLIRNEG